MSTVTRIKKDTNYHTTLINCIFEFKLEKSEVMAYSILSKLLSKSNKKYPSIDKFGREKLNRYIMSLNVINQTINNSYFINFSLLLPNPNIISDFDISKSINFLLDTIYDTNLESVELFELEKRLYIETLLNNYKNVEFIAEKNMLEMLDKDCKLNKLKYKDIENINRLTLDDILKFYNKYIKNFKPKIFVYGNIEKKEVENIFDSYFNNLDLKEYKVIKDYNSFKNYELVEKEELTKFQQSIIYMVYNIKDYKESDFYKLYLINLLLSNPSSDLLFNNLRKKNNLVYACSSSMLIRNGLLITKAITSKKNIKLAKLVIEKTINDLKNINDYKENIERIVEKLEYNLLREEDNFYVKPSNIINEYFSSDINSKDELEIIKNISIDELLECINRLELNLIYTLEGVA